MKLNFVSCLAAIAVLSVPQIAAAHFPWLIVTADGKAAYFFGENVADRTYKLPASIKLAEVKIVDQQGKAEKVELQSVETTDFVGLTSIAPVAQGATLISEVTFGIYHGSRLNYYTQHVAGKLPTSLDASDTQALPLDLQARAVDSDAGVDVFVTWQGKPLADTDVKLYCAEGHEEGTAKTDATGKVSFNDKQVEDGLNGILVGHKVAGETGTLDGVAYDSASHYLTLTFRDPQD